MLAFDLESLDHERQRADDLELDYILGCSEARVDLTAQGESSIREERDRLIADLKRERERSEQLEAELADARRSWWRRLFTG